MRNKIISLILIIPLVLMACVFSAATVVANQIDIPVSGLNLMHERQEIVNLAEGNTFQINAQVTPYNAKNTGLIFTYEKVGDNPVPTLTISETGLVTATGYGIAKIIVTTKDGAYKGSFLLQVMSTSAMDMTIEVNKTGIVVGDTFALIGKVFPDESLDKNIIYYSSNNDIVRINQLTGECRALSSGVVTLRAVLNNGLNGKIEKQVSVVVYPKESDNPITFNGTHNLQDNIFAENFSAVMEINATELHALGTTISESDIMLEYDSADVENVELVALEQNEGIYKYRVNITGVNTESFELIAKLNYPTYLTYQSKITLNKIVDVSDVIVNLNNFKEYIKLNSTNSFTVEVSPEDFTGYDVNAYFTNGANIVYSNGIYYYKSSVIGTDTLNVEISYDGEVIKTITKALNIINPPTSLQFVAISESYGIEDLLTIGSQKIKDGSYVDNTPSFEFTTAVDVNHVEFATSDESIAEFVDKKLVIHKEGKITLTATEQQSKLLGINLSCSLPVRCVLGVEVGSYDDLVRATDSGKQVVLTNNIMLGEKLIEVNTDGTKTLLKSAEECRQILEREVRKFETTADWNYYKNNPNYRYTTPPKLNYIIKFTNNCFGNGYYLNADNITNMVDATNSLYDFAVFRGPLDMVAIPDVAVKAQDNVCYIVDDNVTINNVELIGANLNGLDTADLNSLDYTGTVVEVMGNNVNIVNSRIKNGRTCLRVYGQESGNYEKINVNVESTVISCAREFLVKMGTNAKIHGEYPFDSSVNVTSSQVNDSVWEACSPKIAGYRHLNDHTLSEQEYNALVEEYINSSEYQALVKTDLTLKNCVLHTSGLFSIGLESSFAGPCIDGATYNSWKFAEHGWIDIAGTSYPTMLNLEGSVKIYDWKKISNIDSTILIDGDLFNFDIAQMIEDVYDTGMFNDLITIVDGEKYAHGGIVMYGGGKNYAVVNNNVEGVEAFGNYSLDLQSFNTSLTKMIKYASGKEYFRALMYGKSSTFNYYKQITDMANGEAYSDLSKYDF